ncbi:MAG: UDP-N-acetylglucosamine--LPS N-acetylglucosamine transferase [Pseudomonadota bacterium]
MRRLLAVASGGGHWQQLMLMRPAFTGLEVTYATTLPGLAEEFGAEPAVLVPDANRHEALATLKALFAIGWLVLRTRPHTVISTGALPGVIALAFGRLAGAETVWVDSVANAEEMSMSGRLAKRFATHWLSQWAHVAEAEGAAYAGSVL